MVADNTHTLENNISQLLKMFTAEFMVREREEKGEGLKPERQRRMEVEMDKDRYGNVSYVNFYHQV